MKQRLKIKKVSLFEPSERKRQRYGKHKVVEERPWEWFKFAQSLNGHLNGPVLMQKAEEISKQLGHHELMSSEEWFYR